MEKNGQTQLTNKHSSKNHDESDIEDCKTHDKYNNSKNNRTSLKNQKNDITKNNEITSKNDNRKLKKETLNKDLCYKKKDSEVIVLTSDFNVENAVPEEECASSKFPIKESKKINESTVESQKNNNEDKIIENCDNIPIKNKDSKSTSKIKKKTEDPTSKKSTCKKETCSYLEKDIYICLNIYLYQVSISKSLIIYKMDKMNLNSFDDEDLKSLIITAAAGYPAIISIQDYEE